MNMDSYCDINKAYIDKGILSDNNNNNINVNLEKIARQINNNKKTKNSNHNLKLEPYKLTDLTVIGVIEGEHLIADDFETEYDKIKRQEIDHEKEQKRTNRERNRNDNDRNQQNGSSGRRKSPQTTMRINVDDFDS